MAKVFKQALISPPCLPPDGGYVRLIYQPLRDSHTGKIDHLGIVSLIAGHHIVQQLFQLFLADAGGLPNSLFDVLQIDAVGAQGPDVLHRDLVELVRESEPGADLLQQRQLQVTEQLRQLLGKGVQ